MPTPTRKPAAKSKPAAKPRAAAKPAAKPAPPPRTVRRTAAQPRPASAGDIGPTNSPERIEANVVTQAVDAAQQAVAIIAAPVADRHAPAAARVTDVEAPVEQTVHVVVTA